MAGVLETGKASAPIHPPFKAEAMPPPAKAIAPVTPASSTEEMNTQLTEVRLKMRDLEAFGGKGVLAKFTELQEKMEQKIKELETELRILRAKQEIPFQKEILEYKAIQNMDKISDGKNYRTWNEKFKNGFS